MIREKTVFILGAGSSLDYRFPSGVDLKHRIIDGLADGSRLYRLLGDCAQNADHVREFRTLLSRSFQPTIDAFVESRREFVEVAKLACAAELLPCEVDAELRIARGDQREDWHAYLFRQLIPRTCLNDVTDNKLVILTFNFERSFERAWYHALWTAYREPASRLQNVAQGLMPIHIHGSLGSPKWITGAGLEYGEKPSDPDTIESAARGLKLVFDDLEKEDRAAIARALDGAKNICFLGFGYDAANLVKLGLDHERFSGIKIRGTVRGLPPGQLKIVKRSRFGANQFLPFRQAEGTILDMLKWLDYLHE